MANSTNRKKSTGSGKKTTGSRAKTGGRRAPEPEPESSFLPEEVFILTSFAVAVLLFLSNFRLCGSLGGVLRSVQLGLFGMIGFTAPILLFVGTCFALANRGSTLAHVKLAAVIIGIWALCGLAEMLFGAGYVPGQKIAEIYARCAESGLGGGVLGGVLVVGIGSLLGTIGVYLILLVVLVICAVCITEKSVVSVVKRSGGKAYQYAKEDADRRKVVREERKEERRRLREEQKVRGVNLNSTKIEDMPDEIPDSAADDENVDGYAGGAAGREYGQDGGAQNYGQEYAGDAGSRNTGREDGGQDDEWNDAGRGDGSRGDMRWTAEHDDYGPAEAYDNGRDGGSRSSGSGRGPRLVSDPQFDPETGNQRFMDELLPEEYKNGRGKRSDRADVFTGNITRPPVYIDPDDDTVPFDTYEITSEHVQGAEMPLEDGAAYSGAAPESGRRDEYGDAYEEPYEEFLADRHADMADWAEITVGEAEGESGVSEKTRASGGMEVIGGAVTVEEGTKKVVTASGKIIESDTEALQKKLESRRQEAREEKFAGADTEAARSLGRTDAQGRPVAGGAAGAGTQGRTAGSGIAGAGTQNRPAAPVQKPKPAVKKKYIFPPMNLLTRGPGGNGSQSDKEYRETAIKLQQTLRDFGVGVTVTNVSCGPSVTRYELHPEQGVKVSRIVGLADDIKLSLAAADIRIEAPIPGKSAVGIEVPNKEKNAVYLRELLESQEFKTSQSKLTFAVGKDIGGQVIVTDIAKMPHVLIAGATGSGKSVCINTLIMSIIYKADPEDVKMIMVDPKVVELSAYNGIPHLLIPVVTDPKKASGALNWAVAEMDDRYKKFAASGVRDLKGYNAKVETLKDIEDENKPVKMPQILIIIDELADLMMVAPGEVEGSICRLAQLARAAGIHLVIATQRPSVDVITGLIKANVPSRIAFATSSGTDSRTILDMVGAEKLLGKGDMLFFPSGMPKPQRVQGALVTDSEVSKVVDFLKKQGMAVDYDIDIENQISMPVAESGGDGRSDRDEYFAQAGRFIIEKDKASIGMLQRMYKIGFNRAARIMDQLAEAGVVSEDEGTKPRKVLMTPEEFEEMLNG